MVHVPRELRTRACEPADEIKPKIADNDACVERAERERHADGAVSDEEPHNDGRRIFHEERGDDDGEREKKRCPYFRADEVRDEGKHAKISFPVQAPAPAFLAGEVGLYNFLSPITGVNQLFIVNSVGATTEVNASVLSTNANPGNNVAGWARLPSGVLLKWGNGTANGNTAFVFPVAANIPVFTNVMSMEVSTFANNVADTDTFVRLSAFTNLGFNAYGSARTTAVAAAASFQYLAIGY